MSLPVLRVRHHGLIGGHDGDVLVCASVGSAGEVVWGSKTRFGVPCGQSGGDVVLVGEPAEDLLPADPGLGEVDRFRQGGCQLELG
jgi:hypothetical protein